MARTRPYRIIISGGGTGGHIYPAIAIGKALRSLQPDMELLYVGALGKMEMEKIPAAGFPIKGLWISGIQRGLLWSNLMLPFKIIASLIKAFFILRKFKPDVVVGVGGYASWPIVFLGSKQGIPGLLQEQNSFPGIANKILARHATTICVAHEGMEKFFSKNKIRFTGNPVRKDLLKLSSEKPDEMRKEALKDFGLAEDKKTLLVIGGSLGAKTINESIIMGISRFVAHDIQVIWQCGKYYYANFLDQLNAWENHSSIRLFEFLNEMDKAYAAADVVISRAGALAVSELCLVGKPAIFVPSPNVAEDHQRKNAEAFYTQGAALMVEDQEAKKKLVDNAINLLDNEKLQEELANNIINWGRPNASRDIANEILSLVKPEKS